VFTEEQLFITDSSQKSPQHLMNIIQFNVPLLLLLWSNIQQT